MGKKLGKAIALASKVFVNKTDRGGHPSIYPSLFRSNE